MVRVEQAASTVAVRVEPVALTATVMDRVAASPAHRHARITRTATAIITDRADAQALIVVDRAVRAALIATVRVEPVALTAVAARADREALDLVQAEWAVVHRFLQ